MATPAFDTHKFVKELTAAGMKTAQAEVLASSYASLLTDRIATKDDLKALEDRLNGASPMPRWRRWWRSAR